MGFLEKDLNELKTLVMSIEETVTVETRDDLLTLLATYQQKIRQGMDEYEPVIGLPGLRYEREHFLHEMALAAYHLISARLISVLREGA